MLEVNSKIIRYFADKVATFCRKNKKCSRRQNHQKLDSQTKTVICREGRARAQRQMPLGCKERKEKLLYVFCRVGRLFCPRGRSFCKHCLPERRSKDLAVCILFRWLRSFGFA
ncbi:MAG: hypothetical protein ACC650_07115, partial [Gammaproteobacteria bacterium]